MPTNRMRAVPVRALPPKSDFTARDGEPLSFASSLKLIVVGSKNGIWLKWRKVTAVFTLLLSL